jgi:uncharacterized protein YhaN
MTDTAALVQIWTSLRDRLAEESGLSDEDLQDTLDGELDLLDRLRSLMRKRRELLANADALKGMIKEMSERQARMEASAKSIGQAVTHAMQEAGLAKIVAPDFSASVSYSKPPLSGAENLDVNTLPSRFVRIRKEIDRAAIRAALEAGEAVEGCYLGNPSPFITMRVK